MRSPWGCLAPDHLQPTGAGLFLLPAGVHLGGLPAGPDPGELRRGGVRSADCCDSFLERGLGVGTLLGLLLAGLWLVPKLGKFSAARLGCQLILLSLLLLAGVGVLADPNALRIVLFLFGLATGSEPMPPWF